VVRCTCGGVDQCGAGQCCCTATSTCISSANGNGQACNTGHPGCP
jgi:hypothetical protein